MNFGGLIAGIISAVTWGTVFIFGQIAVTKGNCHPILLSFIRFLSASVFLAFYLFFTRAKFKIEKIDLLSFLLLGITGIFGMSIFIFYSLKFTSSTSSSMLMNSNSFIIGIFAYLILKEKILLREILGILIGFSGCYLIITQGCFSLSSSIRGNLLALIAAICWAFYTVWGKKSGVIKKYGAVAATFWTSVFGTLLLGLVLLFLKIPFFTGKMGLLSGIYLGIVPAGIGFTLWFFAIVRIKTIISGILQFIAPLTTGIIAVLWLEEKISFYTIAGGILIIFGVLLSLMKPWIKFTRAQSL